MTIQTVQGAITYRSNTGYSYPHRFTVFVTNSHQSGAGHVTTQIYIRRVPEPTGLVLTTTALIELPINILFTNSHWSGVGHVTYTGFQRLPVRYQLQLPPHRLSHYFVANSHWSGADHV